MTATRLTTKRVEKPWGKTGHLWPAFEPVGAGAPAVGEIWFEHPDGTEPDLLVKYLFTSERLSIQVHPSDEEARARGHRCGKDEAWVVLDAEPHACIAIGTLAEVSREALRAAALDGSIETLVDWKSVGANQCYYSPAGTVHAIGPGLTLVEVQQNIDLTYRLYDYGRPRELHLDDGIAVSQPKPYVSPHEAQQLTEGRTILCDGPKLVLERWAMTGSGDLAGDGRPLWLIPLSGNGRIDDEAFDAGTVWFVDHAARLALGSGSDMLVAYPGSGVIGDLWSPLAGTGE